MTVIDRRGVAKVLARIKTYHSPQDVGESVITSWADAFAYANVTSAVDAEAAVIRHYTAPGANPWVTPGDVIAGVRATRRDRIESTEIPAPNVDPNHVTDYLTEQRAIRDAIADGDFIPDVYRKSGVTLTGVPARLAITAADEPVVERPDVARNVAKMFRRPDAPLPIHYTKEPLSPVRELTPEQIAAEERERTRQLAALETMMRASQ